MSNDLVKAVKMALLSILVFSMLIWESYLHFTEMPTSLLFHRYVNDEETPFSSNVYLYYIKSLDVESMQARLHPNYSGLLEAALIQRYNENSERKERTIILLEILLQKGISMNTLVEYKNCQVLFILTMSSYFELAEFVIEHLKDNRLKHLCHSAIIKANKKYGDNYSEEEIRRINKLIVRLTANSS